MNDKIDGVSIGGVAPLTVGEGVAPLTVGEQATVGIWNTCGICGAQFTGWHLCNQLPAQYGSTMKLASQYQRFMAVGNVLACAPFEAEVVKVDTQNAFAKAAQKVTMQPLKVIYGNEKFPVGTTVFVRGQDYTEPWAKSKFKLDKDEPEIILVPIERILIAKYW